MNVENLFHFYSPKQEDCDSQQPGVLLTSFLWHGVVMGQCKVSSPGGEQLFRGTLTNQQGLKTAISEQIYLLQLLPKKAWQTESVVL